MIPVLGPHSQKVSERIWCAKDKGLAWASYMATGKIKDEISAPLSAQKKNGAGSGAGGDKSVDSPGCDVAALERNLKFSRTHNISGTPTTFFQNSSRYVGSMGFDALSKIVNGASPGIAPQNTVAPSKQSRWRL
jgi:thiol:disulfide interchange protein DsbC